MKIKAILAQELFITIRSLEVILDIVFFPLMSIVVFGFLSTYLTGVVNPIIGHNLLIGMLLWQVIYITQYSVSVGSLWNIWSKNLSNLFITPLTVGEYLFAHSISGVIKALLVLATGSLVLFFFFNFNIWQINFLNLFLFLINLVFFAISTGIMILGMIFRFGTRIQAFAWGLLPLFQPLTAALFPVTVLPVPLRNVAYLFPPTFVFEAARASLISSAINWNYMLISFGENLFYFSLAIIFFSYMFKKSKESGQFARNEA